MGAHSCQDGPDSTRCAFLYSNLEVGQIASTPRKKKARAKKPALESDAGLSDSVSAAVLISSDSACQTDAAPTKIFENAHPAILPAP